MLIIILTVSYCKNSEIRSEGDSAATSLVETSSARVGRYGGGGGIRSEKGGQGKVCWRAGDWEGAVMGI